MVSEWIQLSSRGGHAAAPYLEHGRRVGRIVREIAEAWGMSPRVAGRFQRAAWLHDIGKSALPGELLHKRGPLTQNEFEVVRLHTVLGDRILARWRSGLAETCREAARSHHECWDGSGYPDGWKGAAIPLVARLTAVADTLDTVVRPRPYKAGASLERAFEELRQGAGAGFDPEVVDVCVRHRAAITEAIEEGGEEKVPGSAGPPSAASPTAGEEAATSLR